MERGLGMLEQDEDFCRAFRLTNAAFERSRLGHRNWRPFQIGFLLAALPSVHASTARAEADLVDTLWFATGGGKTEVYLAMLVMAGFVDRMRGKKMGISAWVRFPLRMLSLQQMQRFADIIAAAELVRRDEKALSTHGPLERERTRHRNRSVPLPLGKVSVRWRLSLAVRIVPETVRGGCDQS